MHVPSVQIPRLLMYYMHINLLHVIGRHLECMPEAVGVVRLPIYGLPDLWPDGEVVGRGRGSIRPYIL